MRWALRATAGLACLLALGSCTVPIDGAAGVTVDARGHLLGIIASCDHRLDGGTLLQTNGPDLDNGHEGPSIGTWDLDADTTGTPPTWSLTAADSGPATSDHEPRELRTQRLMSLYGWTEDNSWSAVDVTFPLSETNGLQPGEVLMTDLDDTEGKRHPINVVVPLTEFHDRVCG